MCTWESGAGVVVPDALDDGRAQPRQHPGDPRGRDGGQPPLPRVRHPDPRTFPNYFRCFVGASRGIFWKGAGGSKDGTKCPAQ